MNLRQKISIARGEATTKLHTQWRIKQVEPAPIPLGKLPTNMREHVAIEPLLVKCHRFLSRRGLDKGIKNEFKNKLTPQTWRVGHIPYFTGTDGSERWRVFFFWNTKTNLEHLQIYLLHILGTYSTITISTITPSSRSLTWLKTWVWKNFFQAWLFPDLPLPTDGIWELTTIAVSHVQDTNLCVAPTFSRTVELCFIVHGFHLINSWLSGNADRRVFSWEKLPKVGLVFEHI